MLSIPEGLREHDPLDLSYIVEVLDVENGETEDQLDARLKYEAKKLGLDTFQWRDSWHTASSTSSKTFARSRSPDATISQAKSSPSKKSNPSRDRDNGSSPSRASLSRDYDTFIASGFSVGSHSIFFSSSSSFATDSVFSLPLSQPPSRPSTPEPAPSRKSFRRSLGIDLLKSRRSDSTVPAVEESCAHCPTGLPMPKRATHLLPCKHRLCTQALRETINAAIRKRGGAVPSCCGIPISGYLVELVLTKEEQDLLLQTLDQWDEALCDASAAAGYPRKRQLRHCSSPSPTESRDPLASAALPTKARQESAEVLDRSELKAFCQQQAEQRDRFVSWVEKNRDELLAHHEAARAEMQQRHKKAIESIERRHDEALSKAEDRQVAAEADLREAQEKEKRDTETALKHRRAYCYGVLSTGEPHFRTITDENLAQMVETQRSYDVMTLRHESAINVLRRRQSKRLAHRAKRQEKDHNDIVRKQELDEAELERACAEQLEKLERTVEEKLNRIRWRWDLQTGITTTKLSNDSGVKVNPELLAIEWPSLQDLMKGKDAGPAEATAGQDK